jgi:GT2 family glycosyltransferase
MKNISVIIVTYNGMKWIQKCLESVLNSSVICEITVIDNNSTDETVSYIKSKHPGIILLEQTQNLGFGAANNIGMSYALRNKSDFVFLLNQDAYLQPQTLSILIKAHAQNEGYGVISPIHLNGDGSKLDKNFAGYLKENDTLIFDSLHENYSKSIYDMSFVNAAAWLIPRKTLEIIGGFDPVFYHYAEDDNYCQRLLFHGFKIGVVPKCYIYHDRESRLMNSKPSNQYDLILKERQLKHRWANINIYINDEVEERKRYLSKLIAKLFIKLKFKKANYYKRELALIERIIPKIYTSRVINKQKGTHYL